MGSDTTDDTAFMGSVRPAVNATTSPTPSQHNSDELTQKGAVRDHAGEHEKQNCNTESPRILITEPGLHQNTVAKAFVSIQSRLKALVPEYPQHLVTDPDGTTRFTSNALFEMFEQIVLTSSPAQVFELVRIALRERRDGEAKPGENPEPMPVSPILGRALRCRPEKDTRTTDALPPSIGDIDADQRHSTERADYQRQLAEHERQRSEYERRILDNKRQIELLEGRMADMREAELHRLAGERAEYFALLIKHGDYSRVEPLTQGMRWRIGRAEPCEILIADSCISREHAELRVVDNSLSLNVSMGKRPAEYKGQLVTSAMLTDGQEFTLGTTHFTIIDVSTLNHKLLTAAESLCVDMERFFRRGFGEIPKSTDLNELHWQQGMFRHLIHRAFSYGIVWANRKVQHPDSLKESVALESERVAFNRRLADFERQRADYERRLLDFQSRFADQERRNADSRKQIEEHVRQRADNERRIVEYQRQFAAQKHDNQQLLATLYQKIAALEHEVHKTVSQPRNVAADHTSPHKTEEDILYGRLGLTPKCTDFVLEAARRAYLKAVHPDSTGPAESGVKRVATERFKQAMQVFEKIDALRSKTRRGKA